MTVTGDGVPAAGDGPVSALFQPIPFAGTTSFGTVSKNQERMKALAGRILWLK